MLRPRRHLHRGTVRAAAFWFDPALLGEGAARRRVLAAWMPGAVVYAVAGGYLLRLPRPCVVASHAAPGLPLTVEQGVLSSAPLSATERGRLELREGSVVLVLAGVARVHPLAGAPVVELSQWLDVSAWVMVPVRGLGAPPPPVQVLEPLPPPTRAFFGPSVPTLAPEAQVMLARMAGKAPPEAPAVVRRMGLLARLR
ncbi:bpX6 domain-containing protein, partial [Pyxidicoccus sp. 3LG]